MKTRKVYRENLYGEHLRGEDRVRYLINRYGWTREHAEIFVYGKVISR